MERNYEESLRLLLLSEGGYDNHPSDPGGPTNYGITIYDAQMYAAEFGWKPAGYRITAADVKQMPLWFAKKVYRAKYWDSQRCSELPDGVDYTVFDYGVNSGIGRSKKVLQRVLGVTADGKLGPITMAAIAKVPAKDLIGEINLERLAFLQSLKTWGTFGRGWGRRVASVNATSLAWAEAPLLVDKTAPVGPAPTKDAHAKGRVPAPAVARNVAIAAPLAGAGAGGLSWGWVTAYPWEAGLLVICLGIAATAVIDSLYKKHKARQEAPAPGWQSPKLLAQKLP